MLFNMGHGDFALAPEPPFFMPKPWAYKYTQYGSSIMQKT